MLQLRNIRKAYTTGSFTQTALDDVSISFRDSEFVAILGPSGSGKTTLLNIIGGLDHYDTGDLVIDGISTKEYKDRDWDTFRNNRIGFVFQAYNLIPHQTILANVELALTLSGVSRAERRARALDALRKVGLGDHVDKKPSQLSARRNRPSAHQRPRDPLSRRAHRCARLQDERADYGPFDRNRERSARHHGHAQS